MTDENCGDRKFRGMPGGQPRRKSASLRVVGVLLLALCGGCESFLLNDNVALPLSRLEPPFGERISSGGYRLGSLPVTDGTSNVLVLLAMSGGGKRSASFSYGALKGLRDLPIETRFGPRSLLSAVDAIAGVSGGSFTAAYYGLHREATFGRYETDFLYRDTESNIFGIYLLPWNWAWLINPTVGTNDFMERVYDREMFHGATFADLERTGRPLVAIGATDIASGAPFVFTQDTFDLICSDLDTFPVARAVAASNGFPGLFSPVTLINHADRCGGRVPGSLRRVTDEQRRDARSRAGRNARELGRYLDSERTRYIHLVDGGLADNLALRGLGAEMQDAGAQSAETGPEILQHITKVLVLSIDGQGEQDASVEQRRIVGGIFSVFGLVSGAAIDRFNFETLLTVDQQVAAFVDVLKRARCVRTPLIDGVRCDRVSGGLVHISLGGMPDSPTKARLQAIRTGLTLNRQDVDLLIEAGRTAVLQSEQLRHLLEDDASPVANALTSANLPEPGGRSSN